MTVSTYMPPTNGTTAPNNVNFDEDYVLKLFNLQRYDIEVFHVCHQQDGIHVEVQLFRKPHKCPVCGFETDKIKDYINKKITHSVINNTACFIDYKARRFLCPACHKTFYENNPFTLAGSRISLQTVYNVLRDLKQYNETFTSVANRYHLSPTTVTSIFDKHVQISRRVLPEFICIDEVYAFHSDKSNYVCVLLDYLSQKIIDLLPSRRKHDLMDYLSFIPREERCNVKIVSHDMWETYRIVSKIMFPNAVNSVDKFHVIQELNNKLDAVRIRVMNKVRVNSTIDIKNLTVTQQMDIKERENAYYVLKKFHWLLFTNDDSLFDPNRKKKYNRKLEGYFNFDDLLNYMVCIDNDLDIAYDLKSLIIDFYKNGKFENAKHQLNTIIQEFRNAPIKEMASFANTLARWKREIINSFIIIDEKTKKKMNNGLIENRNKTIKCLKHNSNGYGNWQRFRTRVLFVLNKDTTFLMYPRKKE